MFSLKMLQGATLQNALIAIARYLVRAQHDYGGVNVQHAVSQLNQRFGFVAPSECHLLAADVERFYVALQGVQVQGISQLGYRRFQTMASMDKLSELAAELQAIFRSQEPPHSTPR